MFNPNYLLIASSVIAIALGQIIFKYAALNIRIVSGQSLIEILGSNKTPIIFVCMALVVYFASTIAWVQALRTIPLSVAYTFNALSFLIVPIAGVAIFGEALPRFFFLGSLMIVLGIILVVLK